MDYFTTTTSSGVTIIEDADGKIATGEQGERAKRLKEFLPELAAIASTPRIAIALDQFLKMNAARYLVEATGEFDLSRALRVLADFAWFAPSDVGEPATKELEREVAIVRRAARDIDTLNGIDDLSLCSQCRACQCENCGGCTCHLE